jgi:tetratricopeptide (TPR) repeat protein
MPTTTYMVVDPRHDHGMRVPRPDRTVSLGVPNACNQCHTDRKPQWAADAVKAWYPQPLPGFQTFAEAFTAADRDEAGAAAALMTVAQDRGQSGFVRASAVRRLGQDLRPATLPALRGALADPDALVRAAATTALATIDPAMRASWLAPLLTDPARQVRMDAARALAGEPETRLSPPQREAFSAALQEHVAAERFNADRPEGRANLGNLHATQGRFDEAVAAYRSALALDPSFEPAALNLADVYRGGGLEAEAERTLREVLAREPGSAPAHHALGLSLARQRRSAEALQALAAAARLAPDNPRFAYVHAVALNDAGQRGAAMRTLQAALKRHPDDRELLLTLALFERDAGNRSQALALVQRLAALEPDHPGAQELIRELSGAGR